MFFRLLICAAFALTLFPAFPLWAADGRTRIALVIGNAKYPDSEAPLKDSLNDARDLAEELKRDGFEVEVGENLTGDGMRRALERLYGKIKPGSVAMLFFSGYGIQSSRQSYLIPVDAQIWTETDVRRDGFSLEAILGEINSRGAGVKIALLDASRRNPFERRFRSFSAGLAPVIAPSGTLVMYSAALSSVVADSGRDRSLFVGELLKEIRVPDLSAEETLNRTRVGVTRASQGEQVPWLSSSLAEDFSFIPGAKVSAPAVIARPRPDPAPEPKPAPVVEAPKPAPAPAPAAETPRPASTPAPAPAAEAAKPAPADSQSSVVASLPPKPAQLPPPAPATMPDKIDAAALQADPTVKDLTTRLAANPSDQTSYYKRGQVYASRGAYRAAIGDFDQAIRLNARDVEAFNNRCWTRTVIGDLQPARADCDEALRLRPGFVDALDSRGLLNLKSGQYRDAIADFDAALAANPRLTSSLYGRGLARLRNGQAAEGERDITNAKAMDPNIVREFAGYGLQ